MKNVTTHFVPPFRREDQAGEDQAAPWRALCGEMVSTYDEHPTCPRCVSELQTLDAITRELDQLPPNSVPEAPLHPLAGESREAFLERAQAHFEARCRYVP